MELELNANAKRRGRRPEKLSALEQISREMANMQQQQQQQDRGRPKERPKDRSSSKRGQSFFDDIRRRLMGRALFGGKRAKSLDDEDGNQRLEETVSIPPSRDASQPRPLHRPATEDQVWRGFSEYLC